VATHKPSAKHLAFRDALIEVIRKHGEDLSTQEMLALASHMVGQLLALQDQRIMTPQQGLEIIARNVELGNQEAVNGLLNSSGGTA
jgi:hypothetical protein